MGKDTKRKQPTAKQIEAYRLVYVHGLTQEGAAEVMKISQSVLNRHLQKLFNTFPNIFDTERASARKVKSYTDSMADKVVRKF